MSTTSTKQKIAHCSEAYFAEVDFPSVIQPRLVIEYTDGLKILIASQSDLALAAELITELRRQHREGGRS
ncbi:hypothetical protein N9891_01800 [bacterium]|nr:hypothetical protein [bacterium]